ncbi:hypothetical protein [Actinomadura vinacea]|uniref:hypothetical protein n=1 Tax=Actinomadura vinacea TaxID=115336 RepID=UPI0031DA0D9D
MIMRTADAAPRRWFPFHRFHAAIRTNSHAGIRNQDAYREKVRTTELIGSAARQIMSNE